ncbi:MAG: hypothetical protein KAI47_20425, partial [Deltaproteobacteria bacterium]|nr:hypothetical protein [Deltaproteobacteria bacterium]
QYDWLLAHTPPKEKILSFRLAKARVYADLKREGPALAELVSISRAYPKSLRVHRELASIYLSNDSFDLARRELQVILTLRKDDPQTLASLAKLEAELKAKLKRARRRAARERAEEDRYQDWRLDLQQRAEDF